MRLNSRFVGTVMMTVAIASLIITLIMLVQLWMLRQPITDAALAGVSLVGVTLDTTSDALATVQQTLDTTSAQVDSLDQMSKSLAQSMHDTGPLVDSLKKLVGNELPSTLRSTVNSLDAAQSSAKLVDDVLSTLTRVPFLPVQPYQPQTPLNSALAQMSSNLDALNPSLAELNTSLSAASGDLATMEAETREISQSIQRIKQNTTDVNRTVTQYRQTVLILRTRVNELAAVIPGVVVMATFVLSFVLSWLVITQIDMLIRGYALVRAPARARIRAHSAAGDRIRKFESEEA